ncbi:MAG: hypothetical protein K1X83_11340 [Oligoflexia bacterium]|nr:hypothetical protein [Oligoflexia bacterium]
MTKIVDSADRQSFDSMLLTGGAEYRAAPNSDDLRLEVTSDQLEDLRQEMLADRALQAIKSPFRPHWCDMPIKILELSPRLHARVTAAPFLAETVGELVQYVGWTDLELGSSDADALERAALKERLNHYGISLQGWLSARFPDPVTDKTAS